MDNKEFYLSALIDFPDDSATGMVTREGLTALFEKLKECNVKRVFWYYYGEDDDCYFSNAKNPGKAYKNYARMLKNIPSFNRVAVDIAHSLGLEIVGVMRTSESGNAAVYSEFYPEIKALVGTDYVKSLGGYVPTVNKYVREHPEARLKRRTYDIDEDAEKMNICKIELRKQNDLPTRITKENLKIYVSENNYNYREYEGGFDFEISTAVCDHDVWAVTKGDVPYCKKRITKKGEVVTSIVLSGFEIEEQYVAVTCNSDMPCDSENTELYFKNVLMAAVYCYGKDGTLIPITVGNEARAWGDPEGRSWKECGLGIDSGYGSICEFGFDTPGEEGVIGFARGKNRYVHSHLCECDEGVQQYWFNALENCVSHGFDMISSREENHSIMTNESVVFGYNDSIKEKYFARYGKCEEKDMDTEKIAEVRGDVYSELFIKGAEYVRKMGKKVVLPLNLEMLHEPIPLGRVFAYPMNVKWQWRRWLKEIKPDEIVVRTFRYTPEFVLKDPQSLEIINEAKKLNIPMAYERYVYPGDDFGADYKTIKNSGLFDSMTLYETCNVFGTDENDKIIERIPGIENVLKGL